MKIVGRIPAREIEGAERVLEGRVGKTESGNMVRFWPAMTRVEGDEHQVRIAFLAEWLRDPTPNDTAEFLEFTGHLMDDQPPVHFSEGRQSLVEEDADWLRTGKIPPPRKKGN